MCHCNEEPELLHFFLHCTAHFLELSCLMSSGNSWITLGGTGSFPARRRMANEQVNEMTTPISSVHTVDVVYKILHKCELFQSSILAEGTNCTMILNYKFPIT